MSEINISGGTFNNSAIGDHSTVVVGNVTTNDIVNELDADEIDVLVDDEAPLEEKKSVILRALGRLGHTIADIGIHVVKEIAAKAATGQLGQ